VAFDFGSPLIALVTDRRRLASRLQRPPVDATALLLSQVEAAAHAGIPLVIVREHDLEARTLVDLVRRLRERTATTATRILVNERLDVALAADAHGAHLREQSFASADARRLSPPGFLLGRSVHDEAGARAAGPVDYLIAGTVFESRSKPSTHTLLGLDGLRRVAAQAVVPVLGIGGIGSGAHVRAVLDAGAAGVAAIGAFQPATSDQSIAADVQNCAYTLRSGFDLSGGLS
jgi:thiamine-phosphate pyrophosphorylase